MSQLRIWTLGALDHSSSILNSSAVEHEEEIQLFDEHLRFSDDAFSSQLQYVPTAPAHPGYTAGASIGGRCQYTNVTPRSPEAPASYGNGSKTHSSRSSFG
ncbi:hypothetical protein CC2G_007896 [Coprinopsis cinerea AmutBmut pab1-1]|nr:hypothetical protein CC2G_007896 [Coprinopsis cinerea AmutBmut pab1-1]